MWARELVWLAVTAVVCLAVAVVTYLLTEDPVWGVIFGFAALTFAVLSLRDG